jgi:hypothetical protein
MTRDSEEFARLIRLGLELCANVKRDERGELVAGQWVNGNGGLLSSDTMRASDRFEREAKAYLKWHRA